MISDNTVHGDNIYLRELQNFFFEVLGMMSITHYGAIGDGRTDNYGPLQVAIDDAHRRGLNYLYVPFGRFVYTGELTNIGDLTFTGNPHSHIVNVRTGEEITVHQFGAFNGSGNFYTKEESNARFVNVDGDTMTGTLAIGPNSVASGNNGTSAQGGNCVASGDSSHASGRNTQATRWAQFAMGVANIPEEGTPNSHDWDSAALVVGNGTLNGDGTTNVASNAYTLDWMGNGWFAGNVYVGSTSGTNKDTGSKMLATIDYVDDLIIHNASYFPQFIAPTHWDTQVSAYKEYTTTDGYGTWRVYADNVSGSDFPVSNAFDDNNITSWKSDDLDAGDSVNVGMDFPVLIRPFELKIMPSVMMGSSNLWSIEVQGEKEDNTWETLMTTEMPQSQNPTPIIQSVTTYSWFKGFRAVLTKPSGISSLAMLVAGLEITKGLWKEMN